MFFPKIKLNAQVDLPWFVDIWANGKDVQCPHRWEKSLNFFVFPMQHPTCIARPENYANLSWRVFNRIELRYESFKHKSMWIHVIHCPVIQKTISSFILFSYSIYFLCVFSNAFVLQSEIFILLFYCGIRCFRLRKSAKINFQLCNYAVVWTVIYIMTYHPWRHKKNFECRIPLQSIILFADWWNKFLWRKFNNKNGNTIYNTALTTNVETSPPSYTKY